MVDGYLLLHPKWLSFVRFHVTLLHIGYIRSFMLKILMTVFEVVFGKKEISLLFNFHT